MNAWSATKGWHERDNILPDEWLGDYNELMAKAGFSQGEIVGQELSTQWMIYRDEGGKSFVVSINNLDYFYDVYIPSFSDLMEFKVKFYSTLTTEMSSYLLERIEEFSELIFHPHYGVLGQATTDKERYDHGEHLKRKERAAIARIKEEVSA
jgi:hypothetical protein